jgi:hypothetical protein
MANPASLASVATKNFPARKSLIGVGYKMGYEDRRKLILFTVGTIMLIIGLLL